MFSAQVCRSCRESRSGGTFSGYVCFFPENLCTGSTPDNNILEHTKITDILKIHKIRCLADGGFKGCSEVILPFTKTQIWPLKRLLGQTEQDYEDEADKKLEFNEMVAHYRSRVEHLFSSSNGVGRWTAFGTLEQRSELYSILCIWFLPYRSEC